MKEKYHDRRNQDDSGNPGKVPQELQQGLRLRGSRNARRGNRVRRTVGGNRGHSDRGEPQGGAVDGAAGLDHDDLRGNHVSGGRGHHQCAQAQEEVRDWGKRLILILYLATGSLTVRAALEKRLQAQGHTPESASQLLADAVLRWRYVAIGIYAAIAVLAMLVRELLVEAPGVALAFSTCGMVFLALAITIAKKHLVSAKPETQSISSEQGG